MPPDRTQVTVQGEAAREAALAALARLVAHLERAAATAIPTPRWAAPDSPR
jgi:hypothetical protein